jgi:hypothetical protein
VAIAPAAFCLLLQECGFVDRTPVECPPLLRSRRPTDALRPDRDRTDGPTR